MSLVIDVRQGGKGGEPPGAVEKSPLSRPSCDRPAERGQFVGALGLSAVRELAVMLGLIDIDNPDLWEAVE